MSLNSKGPSQESDCLTKSWGKVVSSATLLGQDKSIVILHDGQRYTLRITKLRKLILTK